MQKVTLGSAHIAAEFPVNGSEDSRLGDKLDLRLKPGTRLIKPGSSSRAAKLLKAGPDWLPPAERGRRGSGDSRGEGLRQQPFDTVSENELDEASEDQAATAVSSDLLHLPPQLKKSDSSASSSQSHGPSLSGRRSPLPSVQFQLPALTTKPSKTASAMSLLGLPHRTWAPTNGRSHPKTLPMPISRSKSLSSSVDSADAQQPESLHVALKPVSVNRARSMTESAVRSGTPGRYTDPTAPSSNPFDQLIILPSTPRSTTPSEHDETAGALRVYEPKTIIRGRRRNASEPTPVHPSLLPSIEGTTQVNPRRASHLSNSRTSPGPAWNAGGHGGIPGMQGQSAEDRELTDLIFRTEKSLFFRNNALGKDGDGKPQPIWRPGGMDEASRQEFMKKRKKAQEYAQKAREENRQRRLRKRHGDDEDDEAEEDAHSRDELSVPEPPLLSFQATSTEKLNEAIAYEERLRASDETSTTMKRRSQIDMTAILMYDPLGQHSAIRDYPRLSRPPKARKQQISSSSEDLGTDEDVEAAPDTVHSMRTLFLNDFTILSASATTRHELDMQDKLRDVNAIGMLPRDINWNDQVILPMHVPDMAWNLLSYLKCGDIGNPAKGMMPDALATGMITYMGEPTRSDEETRLFLRTGVHNLDRKRYLYLKAIIGHLRRLALAVAEPMPFLLPAMCTVLAPIILPQIYIPPFRTGQRMSMKMRLSDFRTVPGFKAPEEPPHPPAVSVTRDPSEADLTLPVIDPNAAIIEEREACVAGLIRDTMEKATSGELCFAPLSAQAELVKSLVLEFESIFGEPDTSSSRSSSRRRRERGNSSVRIP
ncbi:hypothetical protein DFS34DRAFT_629863 [Phlyctochytrium arcticum]|nr:hypothetical protein DFS34DRAFT_629863 [Phlyctochytrium arcticum]